MILHTVRCVYMWGERTLTRTNTHIHPRAHTHTHTQHTGWPHLLLMGVKINHVDEAFVCTGDGYSLREGAHTHTHTHTHTRVLLSVPTSLSRVSSLSPFILRDEVRWRTKTIYFFFLPSARLSSLHPSLPANSSPKSAKVFHCCTCRDDATRLQNNAQFYHMYITSYMNYASTSSPKTEFLTCNEPVDLFAEQLPWQ